MDIEDAAPQPFGAPAAAPPPANINLSTNPIFFQVGCLDTYHDFAGVRGKFDVTNKVKSEIDRFQNLYATIASHVEKPEEGAEQLLGLIGTGQNFECTESSKPAVNLKSLASIFGLLGYPVGIDGTQDMIYVVCDAGPMHIGSLAKNVDPLLNIVHLVTPATACDSSGIKRGTAFNKPVIFKDGGQEPSGAAFFSGATIFETSNPYDTNTPPSATIHVGNQLINIDSSGRGPSVDMLNAAIAHGTQGRYNLARFPPSVLFDIKRCADIDQIKHTALIRAQNPRMRIVFVTIDRICAFIAVYFFRLPTILQTCNKRNKYFRVWTQPQAGGNSFPIKTGGEDLIEHEGEDEERLAYDSEQDYINLLASLASDKLRTFISTNFPALAAQCSLYSISKFDKYPLLQAKYVDAHNAIYTKLEYPADQATVDKLQQLPPFDFRTLLTVDYSQFIIAIGEELHEIYQGEEEMKKFIDDKPIAKEVARSLFYQPAPESTNMFLTLAILSDFIDFPNNPGMSVISRFVFNGFLPKNPHIPNISNWDQSTRNTYHQLLFAIIPVALANGTLSKESLGLAGGNKKTYRRRRNRNKKTSRNKLKKRKRT